MHDLGTIRKRNKEAHKASTIEQYRVERDRLAQALRKVLTGQPGAEREALQVLNSIYGEGRFTVITVKVE